MNKILIANRGEIASRVISTCKKMDIKTVAIYAQDDRDLLYVSQADESVYIGYGPLSETYLNQENLINIAKEKGCDAIYPGYGFLSENAEFAKLVVKHGLKFIGPTPEAIKLMGDKKDSKQKMQEIGAPLVPGYHGDNQDANFLESEAVKIGFPVLIKASAGGGGKGMRIVHSKSEFLDALSAAKREALNAFSNDKVLIEKYILSPRHIEVQLVGDAKANVFHFFERECSIQRRYQKIVEETPALGMTHSLRMEICNTAVEIATSIDYIGAGTVEFILDENNQFYFLEMNTRLQVEHPITEMVTGVDLVELQIKAARGETFSFRQEDISQNGHAIECRIYAEDPDNDFLPTSGRIQKIKSSVFTDYRLDHSLRDGENISLNYDPMLAKVIVHDSSRAQSIKKMQQALSDTVFAGVKTNRDYLKRILRSESFMRSVYTTNFVTENKDELKIVPKTNEQIANIVGAALFKDLKNTRSDFLYEKKVRIDGNEYVIIVKSAFSDEIIFSLENKEYNLSFQVRGEHTFLITNNTELVVSDKLVNKNNHRHIIVGEIESHDVFVINKVSTKSGTSLESEGSLLSPMPGKIFKILTEKGKEISKGEPILILEAMKMEHVIKSTTTGVVKDICFKEGDQVMGGVQLAEIEG